MGNQRVGIFPPKSEILFVLSLALIWCRNFQDRTIPVGGDTWPSFWRKEFIIIKITRKTTYASVFKSRTKQTRKKVTGVTRQWTEVTRTSTDCQTTFLDVWSNLEKFWKKSLNGQATVFGGHATVGQLSNNVFGRFKRYGDFLKKVAELSRDSGRRSRDRRPTVKQRFLDVSSDLRKFWKKSLNGHATVVGGHATVGRLSNNVFWTFQAIWENFEKSRWTVTRQWLRSRDRRPTVKQRFFGRFKQLGNFLKKVIERSRDSSRRSRERRPTVKQRSWTFEAIWKNFEKSRWTVRRQYSVVTRPSGNCQITFLDVSSDMEIFWKKSLNCHATVVGGLGRLSNNVFWTFLAICENFEKSRWTVTRQWSEVTRPSADCQTTFFGRFKRFGKILKKVAERSRDSGRRSRDRRPTVKQRFLDVSSDLRKFWKSRWTVTRQWSEVTRLSADCQTTIFRRFKQLEFFLKKVAERSRDSGRRSRDRRPTVKQRFLDVSSNLQSFWKKSLNGHATVVEVTRPSTDCQITFFGRFKQ